MVGDPAKAGSNLAEDTEAEGAEVELVGTSLPADPHCWRADALNIETTGPILPCCALCSEAQRASSWPLLMKAKPAVWTGKGSQQEYIAWFCTELRLCVTPHRVRGGVQGCPLMTSSTELM